MARRSRTPPLTAALAAAVTLLAGALTAGGWAHARGGDRVDIADAERAVVVPAGPGRYDFDCGTNAAGHRNTANVVVTPGVLGPAHHVHDYVGNLSTGPHSTDESLRGAATSCGNGDRSTFYWPVLRAGDEHSEILTPSSVRMEYLSSAAGPVVAPPSGLRAMTGDARAATGGTAGIRAWTCEGAEDRRTDRYPRCPAGRELRRVFEFPSCWDGLHADSAGHRRHLTFPGPDGACARGTFAVPRLRVTVGYRVSGAFTVDAFAEQRRSPRTDHGIMINLAPGRLMADIVACLNQGRACTA
ncbi:DUF1996 domain-containing protein [Catenuloplanes atrovinosus]|uniref:DUF1996 domain-containing protein n=1 Tax=Catenuloplanes atrovinosus TaxID=137266 RepID=A0AAE4CAT4_9ACTN|nr:DUF1996 domain-containing protein [Catenuloplanes atrovinosus]MDR7274920.1 hypothetical protein [Catenuloplanes atrovinosus]